MRSREGRRTWWIIRASMLAFDVLSLEVGLVLATGARY